MARTRRNRHGAMKLNRNWNVLEPSFSLLTFFCSCVEFFLFFVVLFSYCVELFLIASIFSSLCQVLSFLSSCCLQNTLTSCFSLVSSMLNTTNNNKELAL